MLDQRGRLLMAALGFAGCYALVRSRALGSADLARLLVRIGHVAMGMRRQGFDLQLTQSRRARLAGDLLHDRNGALSHERDGHRLGAHALARDAARGVGGDDEVGGNMMTGSCGAVLVRVVAFG
jgi:hypothetical protein